MNGASSSTLRDRSTWRGSPAPGSFQEPTPFGQMPSGQRYADDLESQNDEQLEGLSAKVKLLKDVSEYFVLSTIRGKRRSLTPLPFRLMLDHEWNWT